MAWSGQIDTCWLQFNFCSVAALDPSTLVVILHNPDGILAALSVGGVSYGILCEVGSCDMLCLASDRYMLVPAQLLFGCSVGTQYVPHSFA